MEQDVLPKHPNEKLISVALNETKQKKTNVFVISVYTTLLPHDNGVLCVSVNMTAISKSQIQSFLCPVIRSMERTSSIRLKAMARQHKAEVMIAGEQLR